MTFILEECYIHSRTPVTLTIQEVAYHRNGIGGIGFHVVKFLDPAEGPMLGIVFPISGTVAVFNRNKLAEDDIRFGYNSWRGDAYEPYLHRAIERSKTNGQVAT